ncbi:Aste57867_15318 [Aphanomyces stellatus]|uniref:Aste57867_15318 protein n=1 Tax=Aphanomyces stellatus TaxID=120398 RepID=A0A485L3V7_9STRA|nr:hypothetical protein As57867_015262 [Aphanomyces stellatus]VFT92127.1 Aste57867_15318 [Aphanomyces stellatus]
MFLANKIVAFRGFTIQITPSALMLLSDFEVRVIVDEHDGQYAAPEFKTRVSVDGKATSAYIEAAIGKEYWLQYRYVGRTALSNKEARRLDFYIDGAVVAEAIAHNTTSNTTDVKLATSSGWRQFRFCKPSHDDGRANHDPKRLAQIGSIVVHVMRGTATGVKIKTPHTPIKPEFIKHLNVKDASSAVVTSVGKPTTNESPPIATNKRAFVQSTLLQTFKFTYMPRQELVHIMDERDEAPRPRSKQTKHARIIDDDDDDDDAPRAKCQKRNVTSMVSTEKPAISTTKAIDVVDLNDGEWDRRGATSKKWTARQEACRQIQALKPALGHLYLPAVDLLTRATFAKAFVVIAAPDQVEWLRWKLREL